VPTLDERVRANEIELAELRGVARAFRVAQYLIAVVVALLTIVAFFRGP
jgi:hypothetical protein